MSYRSNTTSPEAPLILAADVGGTKTLLTLRHPDGDIVTEQRYASQAFDSLEMMVLRFLEESKQPRPRSACFAVAGPVSINGTAQRAKLTNLPWQLDTQQLSDTLGIPHMALLNDFQAIGYSLAALPSEDLATLHRAPTQARGPQLVVGAGTGLGVSLIMPDGDGISSYPSEGGHMTFAPRDDLQRALLEFMQSGSERVSCERLISGPGLIAIYRFLLSHKQQQGKSLLATDDPAAAIGELAISGTDIQATEAVALFVSLYGAFAGDMALACLPTGGVFIAGGIAPKLLPCLQQGGFMEAFFDKGRMAELMQRFPVHVITNPHCGLIGAARYAARL